jgi:hypothetical protein
VYFSYIFFSQFLASTGYEKVGDFGYFFKPTAPATFTEAQKFCGKIKGHLVTKKIV